MSLQSWEQLLVTAQVDGPTLVAAAAASCLPSSAKYTLLANHFFIGRRLRIQARGRISCLVTTPGTARFDVRLGGTVVFDTGQMNLNIVAKTTVPWWLDIDLECRSIGSGTSATLMGFSKFTSEAVIGAPLPTVGGVGTLLSSGGSVGGPPAVGGGFDSTTSQQVDVFFTQTVATGSLTTHLYSLESSN